MTTRAVLRIRRHDLFLSWMLHRERILALNKNMDNKKNVPPRRVIITALMAAFFGASLLGSSIAAAAQSAVTDEELLAALNYDPKKTSAKVSDELEAKSVEAGPKPAVTLKSVEKVTAAPKAAKAEEKKLKTVSKTISGQVVTIWKNKLAVQFAESETAGTEEMLIPLDKKLRLSGVKALSEIKPGDTVKVNYELLFEDKKGDKRPEAELPVLGTKAVALTLLKKAPAAGALYAE